MLESETHKLTDEQMIEVLRKQAHWTVKEPWTQIADRLEQLSKNERKS